MTVILTGKESYYSKHSGVRSALHRDFIKEGKINKEVGKLYDELFNARHQADYDPFVKFDEKTVRNQLDKVKNVYIDLKLVAHKIVD